MTVDEIKRNLEPIIKTENIQKAILFGSYATGNQTSRSDIDIIFIKETKERFLDRLNDKLFTEIMKALNNKAIDVLIYNPEEFSAISERKFFQRIQKEGIYLYGTK